MSGFLRGRRAKRIALFIGFAIGVLGGATRPAAAGPVDVKKVEGELDHFLCYYINQEKTKPFAGIQASLQDQFKDEPRPFKVSDHVLICNPVEKTVSVDGKEKTYSYKHEEAHLVCYDITHENMATDRIVANQFVPKGFKISVESTYALCVPSGKALIDEEHPNPEDPAIPREEDLDHFVCYMLTENRTPPKQGAQLRDQFVKGGYTVKSQRMLCNPVKKTVKDKEGKPKTTPWHHEDAHLVCYIVGVPDEKHHPERGKIVRKVLIHNQLEDKAVIETQSLAYLCVPSTKDDVPKTPKKE